MGFKGAKVQVEMIYQDMEGLLIEFRKYDIITFYGGEMNRPIFICEDSFQIAWAKAIRELCINHWDAWNIIVQIDNPESFNRNIHSQLEKFVKKYKTKENGLISPNHVAHTIFPQRFFMKGITRERLYAKYWRFFNRPREKPRHGWGTYFARMISYSTQDGNIDQLGNIISSINNRPKNYGSSYTIIIPYPHKDSKKTRGAPCLNYITIQTENAHKPKKTKIINMLAVYRNHDFTNRAYGNYLGLCNLLRYIACETNSQTGTLTCVSSHTSVPKYGSTLFGIANNILGVVS
jgi:thymidylate synthase